MDETAQAGTPSPTSPTPPRLFSVLSTLLLYPEADLVAALPALRTTLAPDVHTALAPLLDWLEGGAADLIALQERYVATFDNRPAHSLHLFEHVHGDSRERGQAMVDLREEYLRHGLVVQTSELPDYVPLFLEFLCQIPPEDAATLLGEAIHVLARLGDKLAESDSPYACIFTVLRRMTAVEPQPLPDPAHGELEEGAVHFGPEAVTGEPALRTHAAAEQPVHFYESRPGSRPAGPARH